MTLPTRTLAAADAAKPVMGGFGGYSYVSPWGGSLQWLLMENVRKELELVDEQRQKIDDIRKQLQEETTAQYKKMQEVPQDQRMQKYNEMNAALAEKTEKQIRELLLPHQTKRLKEIKLQMQVLNNYYGAGQALAGDELAKELKITEDQKAKLREVQQEIMQDQQKKWREFQQKLSEEAMAKMLGVLTAQQRKELDRLMGQKFEYSPWGGAGGAVARPGGGEAKK